MYPAHYIVAIALVVIAVIMILLDFFTPYKFYHQAKALGYNDELLGSKIENRDTYKTYVAFRLLFWAALLWFFAFLYNFRIQYLKEEKLQKKRDKMYLGRFLDRDRSDRALL